MFFASLLDCFFPRVQFRRGLLSPAAASPDQELFHSAPFALSTDELRARGFSSIDCIAAGAPYEGKSFLARAIATFKYRRCMDLASDLALLAHTALPLLPHIRGAVLVPVPLYWMRSFARGFNQAELLCERIASPALPMMSYLRRARSTGHQVGRTRFERLSSLQGAFVCTSAPPPHIILVDDVCTTGATLDACAKALKDSGATHVSGLVVACVP